MIPTMCMVQEGDISSDLQKTLANEMVGFSRKSFGEDPEFTWIEVPKRGGFTGGMPSTSVLVSMRANEKLAQAHRVELLKELCGLWMERASKSMNEVVVSISDPAK